jgi:hypothetical protein
MIRKPRLEFATLSELEVRLPKIPGSVSFATVVG